MTKHHTKIIPGDEITWFGRTGNADVVAVKFDPSDGKWLVKAADDKSRLIFGRPGWIYIREETE